MIDMYISISTFIYIGVGIRCIIRYEIRVYIFLNHPSIFFVLLFTQKPSIVLFIHTKINTFQIFNSFIYLFFLVFFCVKIYNSFANLSSYYILAQGTYYTSTIFQKSNGDIRYYIFHSF